MERGKTEGQTRNRRAERTAGGPVERSETTAKQVVLAGMGAVAEALDLAQDRFDRLVERGEQVQHELQERAEEMRRDYGTGPRRSRDFFRSTMTTFLDNLNVPSKGDVDVINAKLNILTRKVDNLQVERTGSNAGEAGGAATGSPTGQPEIPPAPEAQAKDDDLAT